jgi:uncharacterized iron-regulated protein
METVFRIPFVVVGLLCLALTWSCTVGSDRLIVEDLSTGFGAGVILRTADPKPVSFEEMAAELAAVRVVYVGERHTRVEDHAIQLRVIQTLHAKGLRLAVGMEMFDRSYQAVLDRWTAGQLDEATFLKMTHWYANWRYDFGLYRDLLNTLRDEGIRLVALNLPFHIPAKIRVGGIEYLSDAEKQYLAAEINVGNEKHRSYARDVFDQHAFGHRTEFEDFYLAQCAWEDTMAANIAAQMQDEDVLIALMGNGHIRHRYGVPERAFKRSGTPFRTVYPARVGETVARSVADFIWVTP